MCVCEMWEKERERTDETLWENLLQVYLLPFLSSWFHCYLLLLLKKMMFLLGCRCVIPWKKSQHQRNDPWPRFGCRCIEYRVVVWTKRKKSPMTLYFILLFAFSVGKLWCATTFMIVYQYHCYYYYLYKGCGNLKLFINFYHGITGYWVSNTISLFFLWTRTFFWPMSKIFWIM